ncbi:MAG: hypothetical protein WCF24_10365 [Acidimicrobiales bacterium]
MDEDTKPEMRFHGEEGQPRSATDDPRPAFYAARSGSWGDWWTLLHPPYTAWHLAYVVIGASLAPLVNATKLIATVLAFFLAVGLAAHALDELNGRPLGTGISDRTLGVVAAIALAGAIALGIAGVIKVGWVLVPFLVIGPVLVVGYCSELLGGVLHNDLTFGIAWGAFPVLTAYVAQTDRITAVAVLAALAALAFSVAQRLLSTPARLLRRRASAVEGSVQLTNGVSIALDRRTLLIPLERALRAMAGAMVLLATALAIARLT